MPLYGFLYHFVVIYVIPPKLYSFLPLDMSGYGTKKRGADVAQQLTFPAVFSEVASLSQNPYGYLPQSQRNPVFMPEGNDLQDKYHQQKKMDADRRVMNAVMDNRASTARFLRSHANYDIPRPVLSQRQFANPSNGNQADIYNNRAIDWNQNTESLMGGVLYTQEAQKWGRQKLRDRIPQLDAIELAKQAFLTDTPLGAVTVGQPAERLTESASLKVQLEITNTIQSIATSLEAGRLSPLTVADTLKFLRLLFRWASGATFDELDDVKNIVEYIIESLEGITDELDVENLSASDNEKKVFSSQLLDTMRKTRQYLVNMISVVNAPSAERQKASANFVRSAGFASLSKLVTPEIQAQRERLTVPRPPPLLASPASSRASTRPPSPSSSSSSLDSLGAFRRRDDDNDDDDDSGDGGDGAKLSESGPDRMVREKITESPESASASSSSSSSSSTGKTTKPADIDADAVIDADEKQEASAEKVLAKSKPLVVYDNRTEAQKRQDIKKLHPTLRPRPTNLAKRLYAGNAKDLQANLVAFWSLEKARARANADEIRQNIRAFYGL